MAVRFNRDTHSFHIFRVYHSLSLPGEEWEGQVFSGRHSRCWRGHWACVQSPHCRALASVCQNTLSPKDFLHSSIVFMLGKWQSLFLLQQCCIDPFIIWSEKKDGLKQMWDLLDYCDTLTVNIPFVLIEIAIFPFGSQVLKPKQHADSFICLRNTLSNSSLFIIQEVLY